MKISACVHYFKHDQNNDSCQGNSLQFMIHSYYVYISYQFRYMLDKTKRKIIL